MRVLSERKAYAIGFLIRALRWFKLQRIAVQCGITVGYVAKTAAERTKING